MRGHEHIISMRQSGFKPSIVYLWDMPVRINAPKWVEDYQYRDVCTVGDSVDVMDLRFVVGIPVTVFGDDLKRVRGIAGACRAAGAERVAAMCGDKFAVWFKGSEKWLS